MSSHLVCASHTVAEYKLPWLLLDKKRYEAEIAWYMVTPNIEISPTEYDLNRGGVTYYHDSISRVEAEARLRQRGEIGAFLLRLGSNKQHVISVATHDGIMHLEIKKGPKGGKCLGKGAKEFPDIPQMMMAMYGRPIAGLPVEFLVPVPPSNRMVANDAAAAPPSPEKKEKKKKKKKKQKKEVRKIALADLNTHELRSLLDAHGIAYHHVGSRAELEELCNGLEVKGPMSASQSSLTSVLSGTSIDTTTSGEGAVVSPNRFLLPPSPSSLLPPSSSLLPPSKKVSTKEQSGGGIDLFNKYKAKATSPSGLSAPLAPRGRSSSARITRDKPVVKIEPIAKSTDDIGADVFSSDAAASGSPDGDTQLSDMAADFFGGLFAEAAAGGDDGAATAASPTLGTVVEDAPVAPKGFEEVDDDVTDDSDDDDSDTDSDSDDNDDDDDGGNTHAFSEGFKQKMGSGPPGGRPAPPSNTPAAERAAKRKQKLRQMAQGL